MKFFLAIVFACIAFASAGRLPLPEALQDKFHFLMNDDGMDNPRVVGGTPAASGERPYQIALLRSGSFTCGGSWISSRTAITAAHCVDGSENNPTLFTIRYNTITTSGTTIAVQRIVKHGSYSSSTINNDYALLITATAFTPGTNAAIISLCTAEPTAAGHVLTVSGFGRTSGGGSLATSLLKAELGHVVRTECSSRWGSVNAITTKMICAHSTTTSACNGDSGGPLTQVVGGATCLVGVVSWGSSSCLHQTYPNVYASVPGDLSWINSNTVS